MHVQIIYILKLTGKPLTRNFSFGVEFYSKIAVKLICVSIYIFLNANFINNYMDNLYS